MCYVTEVGFSKSRHKRSLPEHKACVPGQQDVQSRTTVGDLLQQAMIYWSVRR